MDGLVPQVCAPEIEYTAIVAGSIVRGRRTVVVWLTSSAVSICMATNWLRSSPLVQSLRICRILHGPSPNDQGLLPWSLC